MFLAAGLFYVRGVFSEGCCRNNCVKTSPGPSSRNTRSVSAAAVAIAAAKRTVRRMWLAQYEGSHASLSVSHVPVTVETMGTRGGANRTVRTTSKNGSTAASIIAE